MKSFIKIVGQSSPEGPPSIVVCFDNERSMFNCREGTQRLCVEEKLKLSKLKHLYLTRVNWESMGGLPGMLLTLSDAGLNNLNLYGGRNLTHFMAATRPFICRNTMSVATHEFESSSEPVSAGELTVTPVVVLPEGFNSMGMAGTKRSRSPSLSGSDSEESNSPSSTTDAMENMSAEEQMEYRRSILRKMFNTSRSNTTSALVIDAACTPRSDGNGSQSNRRNTDDYIAKPLPATRNYPAAVSYICRGPLVRGKFNKNAALSLGIKPGPIFGRLHKGETVTLEDGRTITPDMVCEPSIPGNVFAIIDCPNASYIDQLIASPQFAMYQTDVKENRPSVVIHLIGDDVLQDARYRKWMNAFSDSTDHIISTVNVCAQTVLYKSHATAQAKLSKLNDEIFRIPKYSNTAKQLLSEYTDLPPKCIPLTNMMQYNLEPRTGVAAPSEERTEFDHTAQALEDSMTPEYLQAVESARADAAAVDLSERFPGDNVNVITLGTGSAVPGKYRNVSATLVKIPQHGSLMLDAGEGTFGQMMRRFGADQLDAELNALRCIFISHLHADHHLGAMQLLTKWYKLNANTDRVLYVVAPFVFRSWLMEYGQVEFFGSGSKIRFVSNAIIQPGKTWKPMQANVIAKLKETLGLTSIETVNVIHCRWAYGLTLQHESGWKIVYSGDTRPCDRLVDAGKDATLLVHEATLEDNMMAEALAKKHSTTGEAIDVGKRMNARFTLLNHFSQRYPKVPVLSDAQNNVCFSLDLMSVDIKQMALLPRYNKAIQLLFNQEEEEKNNEGTDIV